MYDFNSKKYMFLLILICLIFTIFVIKAFDYLPKQQVVVTDTQNQVSTVQSSTEVNNNNEIDGEQVENSNIEIKTKKNQKSGVLYKRQNSLHDENSVSQNDNSFEEIDAPIGAAEEALPNTNSDDRVSNENKLSNEELALKAIITGRKCYSSGEYSSALEAYQKVAELTSDNELLAESYDGISELYAKNKRYSTALSFAGKAYKSSPTLAREFFIAKIYYMAGQTDTAVSRINNMLKRGLN